MYKTIINNKHHNYDDLKSCQDTRCLYFKVMKGKENKKPAFQLKD